MPAQRSVSRCGNCGGPLPKKERTTNAIECAFCHEVTYLRPTTIEMQAVRAGASTGDAALHARFSVAPHRIERAGNATRFSVAAMADRDPVSLERGVWPGHATASSTYGSDWSPGSVVGPPRVYPKYGDRRGAWAPGPQNSATEWLEVQYALDVAVSAVRVFETNRAGSTYAVLDLTEGETLLYSGPPEHLDSAHVLEIVVDPPRVVKALRIYLTNSGWAEIDTVGLIAAEPLPEHLRTAPVVRSDGGGCVWIAVVLALVVFGIGFAFFALGLHLDDTEAPAPVEAAPAPVPEPEPMPVPEPPPAVAPEPPPSGSLAPF